MEFIKCGREYLDELAALYERVIDHLEATVNYPKWTRAYPCRDSVLSAIIRGDQYACTDNGRILGAVVLNRDPDGYYEAGEWSRRLKRGEFMVIHTLAVDPSAAQKGVGSFIVDACIQFARDKKCSAVRLDVVPGNTPAAELYKSKGFTFAGAKDLKRGFDYIPVFELYELNF